MTYTIVAPTVNTNTGYKDTGRLSHYKYEDLQCLAELYAQANACVVCDAKQNVKGGMNQTRLNSTKWIYLGDEYWQLPNYLAPEKQYLDQDRVFMLPDESMCPLPDLGNYVNTAWLYLSANPFDNFSPYMHEDPRLSGAGTVSATSAIFGHGIDLKTENVSQKTGMNRPFSPHMWTDPNDIVKLYSDAKKWSNYDIYTLTWSSDFARNGAYGQPFDKTWAYSLNLHQRRTIYQNGPSPYSDQTTTIDRGWASSIFGHREYWEKNYTNSYYSGGYDPTGYFHYEWQSEVDQLSNDSGNPSLDRNVPIPTSTFGTGCLHGRKLLFVWEAVRRDYTNRSGQSPQDTTTTKWFGYIGDMQQYGTLDYTDSEGYARGLCMRYTFPFAAISQQHTAIKNLLSWSIPAFDCSPWPETTGFVTDQSSELNLYFRGCYTLQYSYLTEILTRPT